MCRKRLIRSTWLVFLGLIYILGSADCSQTDEYNDDDYLENANYKKYQDEEEEEEDENRGDFDYDSQILNKRNPAFTPYISVEAFSNIQQFFENLKENFKSLENLPHEERKALLGRQEQGSVALTGNTPGARCTRKHSYKQETRIFRPPATAAFLHAVRSHRPSQKIKHFVAKGEPSSLRGYNHINPVMLWSGSGRRR